MAKKVVLISDISGEDIADGEARRLVVRAYPGLAEAVALDAAKDEIAQLRTLAKEYVLVEVTDDEGAVERLAIDLAALHKAIKGDADEIIRKAERLYAPPPPEPTVARQRRARGIGGAARAEKVDYTDVHFAGRVKRGIVSEGEKETIRTHFDEVNAHLAEAGQRTLDLSNIEHVEKYGLQELARERGVEPVAKQ